MAGGSPLMEVLRVLSVIAWGLVLITSTPSVVRLLRGKPGRYDTLWAMDWAFAAMVIGFNIHYLAVPDADGLYLLLNASSLLIGSMRYFVVSRYKAVHND